MFSLGLQVAHEFADLHDRSGRMKAKGVVRDILEWKTSRSYFYWRVKRRLAENGVRKMFKEADASMSYDDTTKLMQVRSISPPHSPPIIGFCRLPHWPSSLTATA